MLYDDIIVTMDIIIQEINGEDEIISERCTFI